ncbi:unnamed protein product [Nyctereutes procyonoides]|uniref:(raccoon dog) hypothetical protein n=1 Tax=Nyctereutes procyonoides TaxID=34880 RepID=A0A811ZY83_NYCPR|nr:unnamed protein product [Nyctereutes procyonoides]
MSYFSNHYGGLGWGCGYGCGNLGCGYFWGCGNSYRQGCACGWGGYRCTCATHLIVEDMDSLASIKILLYECYFCSYYGGLGCGCGWGGYRYGCCHPLCHGRYGFSGF